MAESVRGGRDNVPAAAPASPSQAQRVAEYYDAHTRDYYLDRWHPEDFHFGLFEPGDDPKDYFRAIKAMTACILAPAGIARGETVLDAGCGVGGAAVDIARDTGARVLGLTISAVQVELATRRAAAAGVSDLVRFEKADCSTRLPCEDASIDVVTTIDAACHFEDKPNFLAECRRVLRSGGRLAGSDWMATDSTSEADYREFLGPVCESWRLADMRSPSGWREMLEAAGFEVRESVDLAESVLPNVRILGRGRLDLMLDVANGSVPEEPATLWRWQFDTLMRAWVERRFTIGRFFAVAR